VRALCAAIAVIGLCAAAYGQGESSTSRHLLAGVHAFKDGHYEEALVELKVVARAPDAPDDLAFYLGPTLYKLGRYHEALGVFLASHAPPDALTDFYLAQTYYQLGLYRSARGVFADLRTRGLGPALDDAAARYVAEVDRAYAAAPETVVVDAYLAQGLALADARLQAAYLGEARLVEELLPARHRSDEIRWSLGRAYAELGDVRARPLLAPISAAGGPHAAEAAALLAKLPP
jgi:tetratricopeptide (TPR) repeat protein